jgi:aryl-alcohol dehydrogenase-like predicted oxidoreductase
MNVPHLSRRAVLRAGAAGAVGAALGRALPVGAQGPQTLAPVTKPIPSSGERLPVIGLGTNAYSANSPEQMAPLRDVLQRMPQLGGKLVDTARVYGRAESVIGELVQGLDNRKQLFIATKTPMGGDFSNPQAVVDVSFAALRTDVIDLMQIHQMAGVAALMPVFEKMKAAGRIRYIGMSTSSDNQYGALMDAMRTYPLDFVQVDYSIENRNAAEAVLPLAQERKIGVLINVPFGGRGQGAASTFARVKGRPLPDWAAEFDATSWAQVFLKYRAAGGCPTPRCAGASSSSGIH